MSPKNPVSNFISAGDEMLAFLSNLDPKWRISDVGVYRAKFYFCRLKTGFAKI